MTTVDGDRLLFRGGSLIDGTGAAARRADVLVEGDRILAVGEVAGDALARVVDIEGLAIAPGFIDVHTHDDRLLLVEPAMAPKVSQGVTTVIVGNCGLSLAGLAATGRAPPPLDLLDPAGGGFRFPRFVDYVAALGTNPAATNVAMLAGHSTLRVAAMGGDTARAAGRAERARMAAALDEAMDAGALGLSTGTFYPPAAAAGTDELIEISRQVAARGGLYVTHMRDEGDRIDEAIAETLRIGAECAMPVVVSHHKVAGTRNHGRSERTLATLAAAMRDQPVGLDCYPYAASSTMLDAGRVEMASRVRIAWSAPHPRAAGCDLDDLAARWKVSVAEAVERLQPAGAIYFMMSESDVRRVLAFPHTMIGSDGLPHDASPHPRLWGTFPRVLGHYARELGLFTLEEAVRRMTGLPAQRFGLQGRGLLEPGAFADLAVFDPAEVIDRATWDRPTEPAAGIRLVVVNGCPVWRDGAPTGARPGRFIPRGRAAGARAEVPGTDRRS